MQTRRDFIGVLVGCALSLPLVGRVGAQQTDFQKWQGQNKRDYAEWREARAQDYKEFQSLHKKFLKEQLAKIKENWGSNPALRNQTLWVDYDEKVKRVVDFDAGYAEVTIIKKDAEQSSEQLAAEAKVEIKKLFSASATALLAKDDVEEKLKAKLDSGSIPVIPADVELEPATKGGAFASVSPGMKVIDQASWTEESQLIKGQTTITIRVPINNNVVRKIEPFLTHIKTNATEYNLAESFISAVMEVESSFNPLATSRIPAYGLMQIVPTTAGIDVSRQLYGKKVLLSPQWLYNPQNNTLAGSTYLHILWAKYLRGVVDDKSRLYCAIAAYNGGIGNVAKVFSKQGLKQAKNKINALSSERVLARLSSDLPFKETRDYLYKILQKEAFWNANLKQ